MFIFVIILQFKVGIMDRVQIISVGYWSAIGDVSGFAAGVPVKMQQRKLSFLGRIV